MQENGEILTFLSDYINPGNSVRVCSFVLSVVPSINDLSHWITLYIYIYIYIYIQTVLFATGGSGRILSRIGWRPSLIARVSVNSGRTAQWFKRKKISPFSQQLYTDHNSWYSVIVMDGEVVKIQLLICHLIKVKEIIQKAHRSQKVCKDGQTKQACPIHWPVQRVCTGIPCAHGSHSEVQIQPCAYWVTTVSIFLVYFMAKKSS